MKIKLGLILGMFVLISACGIKGERATKAANAEIQNEPIELKTLVNGDASLVVYEGNESYFASRYKKVGTASLIKHIKTNHFEVNCDPRPDNHDEEEKVSVGVFESLNSNKTIFHMAFSDGSQVIQPEPIVTSSQRQCARVNQPCLRYDLTSANPNTSVSTFYCNDPSAICHDINNNFKFTEDLFDSAAYKGSFTCTSRDRILIYEKFDDTIQTVGVIVNFDSDKSNQANSSVRFGLQ